MKKPLSFAATALITAGIGASAFAQDTPRPPVEAGETTGFISQSAADTPKAPAIEDMSFDAAIAAHILEELGDPPSGEGRIA